METVVIKRGAIFQFGLSFCLWTGLSIICHWDKSESFFFGSFLIFAWTDISKTAASASSFLSPLLLLNAGAKIYFLYSCVHSEPMLIGELQPLGGEEMGKRKEGEELEKEVVGGQTLGGRWRKWRWWWRRKKRLMGRNRGRAAIGEGESGGADRGEGDVEVEGEEDEEEEERWRSFWHVSHTLVDKAGCLMESWRCE